MTFSWCFNILNLFFVHYSLRCSSAGKREDICSVDWVLIIYIWYFSLHTHSKFSLFFVCIAVDVFNVTILSCASFSLKDIRESYCCCCTMNCITVFVFFFLSFSEYLFLFLFSILFNVYFFSTFFICLWLLLLLLSLEMNTIKYGISMHSNCK